MLSTAHEPQTPRKVIKPTIVYPCSPGGTEIRPPANTAQAQGSGIGGGERVGERDRFTPGDTLWWNLPKLGEPDLQAAIKAGDWFVTCLLAQGSGGDW